MVPNSLNSNADIVVVSLNGFVGEQLTSVKVVINVNAKETMLVNINQNSCHNAQVARNALLVFPNIILMENNTRWAAQYVETFKQMLKTFEYSLK